MPLTVTREPAITCLPGREPVYARRARQQARSVLAAWGLGEHADLGELIAGELVANALCHGEGPVEMRLSFACGDLRVEVHDEGAGRPVRKHASTDDEGGRGLEVLDGLIEEHGGGRGVMNDHAGPGKTVYVMLSLMADAAGAR
jgi:anti-sigma regulatory factor (Ser/Thr protein kinase)